MADNNPIYSLATPKNNSLGNIGAAFEDQNSEGAAVSVENKEGSLASSLRPQGGKKEINIVKDYPWTLSNIADPNTLEEIPYIRLVEFKRLESSLKSQISFYSNIIPGTGANAITKNSKSRSVLDPYKEMWPKDNPTGWIYKFPYFNKTSFELTSQWESLGEAGEAIKKLGSGTMGLLFGKNAANVTQQALDIMQKGAEAKQAYSYPSVGAVDRPKIFSSHGERSINISCTLYNTRNPNDWQNNRDFVYLLMNQNLFNKRDLTTGVPPVFYEVYIPGQYFCYASYMSNIKIENLGNQRLLYNEYIVPDAYQIEITLTELVQPSKNQLEAVTSGMARNRVKISVDNSIEIATANEL